VHELNREYTRRTLDIIKEGMAAGELREDVPLRLIRDMIYGCTEHRTFAYLRGEGDFDPDATADMIADLVLSGLERRRPEAPAAPDLAERLERAVARLEKLSGPAAP
jgi:TetR/AcrR family transcriptional regulator, fatty acid metabolism regulator protein